MKLLKRLRDPETRTSIPPLDAMSWIETINVETYGTDHDHFGVGAAMIADLVGMEFLDSYRRRIPEIHEEFPPHGLTYDEYEEEAD